MLSTPDYDRRLPILLVEDTPEDVEAVRWALKKLGVPNPFFHCRSGDEAIALLRRKGYLNDDGLFAPALILLDLNLPGLDGQEVLEELKADDDLKVFPVVMLTTSSSPSDIDRCFRAGASGYVIKPLDLQKLLAAMDTLFEYWLAVSKLPKGQDTL